MTSRSAPLALGEVAEASVVALAMNGDAAAFCELVRRRQAGLRNLLRRLSRDPALADDLAQQAFLKAWRALPTPSDDGRPRLVIVDEQNGFATVGAGALAPTEHDAQIARMVEETNRLARQFVARGLPMH